MEAEELLGKTCQTRHNCTNYDRLVVFYEAQPEMRSILNHYCGLFAMGRMTDEEFQEKIEELEAMVNLTFVKNQKRYRKDKEKTLLASNQYSKNQVLEIVRLDLVRVIHRYQNQGGK